MYLKEITSLNKLFYSQYKPSVLLLTKHYSGGQIKKNEMGWACGTCGRQEMCIEGFRGKSREEELRRRLMYKWEDNIKMDLDVDA
jgi:hypothetical protein